MQTTTCGYRGLCAKNAWQATPEALLANVCAIARTVKAQYDAAGLPALVVVCASDKKRYDLMVRITAPTLLKVYA